MTHCLTKQVRGQASFLLKTGVVEAAVSALGGMLGPATFFPDSAAPIQPYAVAPWAEERLPSGTPAMLAGLRGDWFCSAFGENAEPFQGRKLPPHGETANLQWQPLAHKQSAAGSSLRLGVDLPLQGGRCEATTALLADESVIYQRHDLSGLTGPLNPGHHATLACPNVPGSGRLSFSSFVFAKTYFGAVDPPENPSYSLLKPGEEINDLSAVPCVDGSRTDLSRYPARHGFEDLAILCTDPTLDLGWSAAAFPEQGYVWFALRNPKDLASTLLWFSNGGRHYAPWNGRHVNVLGIEDITAFFHVGLAASLRPNLLNERGILTSLAPDPDGGLSIPYIQGVARIPADFDRVAAIEPDEHGICIRSHTGSVIHVRCHMKFLRDGTIPGVVER